MHIINPHFLEQFQTQIPISHFTTLNIGASQALSHRQTFFSPYHKKFYAIIDEMPVDGSIMFDQCDIGNAFLIEPAAVLAIVNKQPIRTNQYAKHSYLLADWLNLLENRWMRLSGDKAQKLKLQQQKWTIATQLTSSFMDSGVVQGERITRSPFPNPAIVRQGLGLTEPLPLRKSTVSSGRRDSNIALISLTIENHERSRLKTRTREGSPYGPSRRGRSITIYVSPRRYSSLEQNITLIENNRYELFLPVRSARYSRIHS